MIAARPTVVRDVYANRDFMRRAVVYLAAESGMRQFLDIGTGISPGLDVSPEVRYRRSFGRRIWMAWTVA